MLKKIVDWLFVLFWMGIIFYFSNLPSLKSELPATLDTIFRKIAHMSEFFVLTYLFFRSFSNYGFVFKIKIFLAMFFSVLYAIFDEYHQRFVFARNGNWLDVLIDSLGITAFIILIFYYKYENLRNK